MEELSTQRRSRIFKAFLIVVVPYIVSLIGINQFFIETGWYTDIIGFLMINALVLFSTAPIPIIACVLILNGKEIEFKV